MAKTKAQARKEVGVKGQASRSKEHGTPPVNKNIKKAEQKQAEPRRVDETGKSVRYRAAPTNAVRERMARALPGSGHRMFLLERKTVVPCSTSSSGPVEEFAVLGATGNVYTVRIGCHPSCTCPDFARHPEARPCKHIAYVLIRVLRIPTNQPEVWQKALLPSEAEKVLSGQLSGRADEEVLADASVRDAYRRAVQPGEGSAGDEGVQRPVEGDCPICYDEMQPSATSKEDVVVFCKLCGNNVHAECFRRWVASKKRQGLSVTCVWCRAPWPTDQSDAQKEGGGDYINLAGYSSAHQEGDTSLLGLYGETAQWIGRRRRDALRAAS